MAHDRRHVVECDHSCKTKMLREQLLHHQISQFGRADVLLQLNDELRVDGDAHLPRNFYDAFPAVFRIGVERLPAHKRDTPVGRIDFVLYRNSVDLHSLTRKRPY